MTKTKTNKRKTKRRENAKKNEIVRFTYLSCLGANRLLIAVGLLEELVARAPVARVLIVPNAKKRVK